MPESEHPASEDMTIRWWTRQFRWRLDRLNRLLDHLSFAASDWAIGAVERRDLPPILPQSTHADRDGRVPGSTFGIPIHDDYPRLATELEDPPNGDAGALEDAVNGV
jgi:hypothetical protein